MRSARKRFPELRDRGYLANTGIQPQHVRSLKTAFGLLQELLSEPLRNETHGLLQAALSLPSSSSFESNHRFSAVMHNLGHCPVPSGSGLLKNPILHDPAGCFWRARGSPCQLKGCIHHTGFKTVLQPEMLELHVLPTETFSSSPLL